MLQPMQSSAAVAPPQASPSFAGLLATFAEPEKKFPPARDEEGLADDIVTLSYEHALRNHSRYRPVEITAGGLGQGSTPVAPGTKASRRPAELSDPRIMPAPAVMPGGPTLMEKNLKRASITMRLSQSDCAQLHQRAAEAGLTVSAYLRSCTLEVESLRAQVKETLAQLRSATSGQVASSQVAPSQAISGKSQNKPGSNARRFWSRLWTNLWPPAKARAVPA